LDTTAYRPKDKGLCKRALGIAPDAFVVCVGAEQIANKRKGLSIAFEALERIRNRTNVVCLQFGGGEELPKRGGLQCKALGFIQSSEIQSLVYSAADVFLLPSLEEAFGQVGIEAMACGTPVIAFNVGGIPEFIRPRTGLLAKLGDAGDLADKIDWMVENSAERLSMGEAGRAVVENEYTLERQADAYRKLYEEVSRCG
jgi:glycosyltransferase involved in cell wall biosynthesis